MKKIIAVMLAGLVLAGCEQREVFSEKRFTMTVGAVDLRSKHSKIMLVNDTTGQMYEWQDLRCRSNSVRNVSDATIGKKWVVTEVTYVYPESKRFTSELIGVDVVCENS